MTMDVSAQMLYPLLRPNSLWEAFPSTHHKGMPRALQFPHRDCPQPKPAHLSAIGQPQWQQPWLKAQETQPCLGPVSGFVTRCTRTSS